MLVQAEQRDKLMNSAVNSESDESLFSPAWRNLSIGTIGLCSMMAFEAIGIATGMPAVATALDGMPLYALAFASTLAASVVAMVWSGLDCDRYGPFRSMAGGLMFFAAGLLLAGLAGSMYTLILGRIIQGLGIGALGVALYNYGSRALALTKGRIYACNRTEANTTCCKSIYNLPCFIPFAVISGLGESSATLHANCEIVSIGLGPMFEAN